MPNCSDGRAFNMRFLPELQIQIIYLDLAICCMKSTLLFIFFSLFTEKKTRLSNIGDTFSVSLLSYRFSLPLIVRESRFITIVEHFRAKHLQRHRNLATACFMRRRGSRQTDPAISRACLAALLCQDKEKHQSVAGLQRVVFSVTFLNKTKR